MVDKFNVLEEQNKKIAEEIEKKFNEMNLKEKICSGGRTKWLAERQAAMKLAHLLMKEKDLDFSEANKISWQYIYDEREKPCAVPKEKSDEEEQIVEQDVAAAVEEPTEASLSEQTAAKAPSEEKLEETPTEKESNV